mgnify:CR=1 FL=1
MFIFVLSFLLCIQKVQLASKKKQSDKKIIKTNKYVFKPKNTNLDNKSNTKLFLKNINEEWREDDIAEFPDAVTSRGTKHLQKLKESIKKGYKPYVLFLTQIQGINNFRIAKDIDSTYYKEYLDAKKSGVSFLAYRCSLNSKEIKIEKKIKIIDE